MSTNQKEQRVQEAKISISRALATLRGYKYNKLVDFTLDAAVADRISEVELELDNLDTLLNSVTSAAEVLRNNGQ